MYQTTMGPATLLGKDVMRPIGLNAALLEKSEAADSDTFQDLLLRGSVRATTTAADLYVATSVNGYDWSTGTNEWAPGLAMALGLTQGAVGICKILSGAGVGIELLGGYGSPGKTDKLKILTGIGDLLTGAGLVAQTGYGISTSMFPFTLMGLGLATLGSGISIVRDLGR